MILQTDLNLNLISKRFTRTGPTPGPALGQCSSKCSCMPSRKLHDQATILKRWNRLKGDNVEASEFLKALYVQDLIFHDLFTSVTKEKLKVFEDDGDGEWEDKVMDSWDSFVIDTDSD